MLGDLITRSLVLVLGYAYPAFECFKTVEKNRVEIEELRFWCQYWIIVALLTIFERIGDIFVSWLPMYGEMKLALFIYLWHPKTKGTGYVYETFVRPYVAMHETDIERSLLELRARAWDLAIYYWQNCTELGQAKFFEILQFLASKSSKLTNPISEKGENHKSNGLPPPSPDTPTSFHRSNKQKQQSDKGQPPIPPPPPTAAYRAISQTPKLGVGQVHLQSQTQYIQTENKSIPEPVSGHGPTDTSETEFQHSVDAVRLRLRRFKGIN